MFSRRYQRGHAEDGRQRRRWRGEAGPARRRHQKLRHGERIFATSHRRHFKRKGNCRQVGHAVHHQPHEDAALGQRPEVRTFFVPQKLI